jgi:hypothetical protein
MEALGLAEAHGKGSRKSAQQKAAEALEELAERIGGYT